MNIRREEPKDYRESENVCPYFLMKELTPGYLGGVTGTYHTPRTVSIQEASSLNFVLSLFMSDVTEPPSESGSTMIEPMSVSG